MPTSLRSTPWSPAGRAAPNRCATGWPRCPTSPPSCSSTTGPARSPADAVLAGADAAVPVVPVVDTVTDVHGEPVDREALRAVQTPQGFRAEVLRRVHAGRPDATDDASLVVAAGGRLRHVHGERWNLKITEPDDLLVAEAVVGAR